MQLFGVGGQVVQVSGGCRPSSRPSCVDSSSSSGMCSVPLLGCGMQRMGSKLAPQPAIGRKHTVKCS